MQNIHRYKVLEEVASKDGAVLYLASPAGSTAAWTLLQWTPPLTAAGDPKSDFLQVTQGWFEEGVESFVYRGRLCLASENRGLLELKAAQLRSRGIFGSETESVLWNPVSQRAPVPPQVFAPPPPLPVSTLQYEPVPYPPTISMPPPVPHPPTVFMPPPPAPFPPPPVVVEPPRFNPSGQAGLSLGGYAGPQQQPRSTPKPASRNTWIWVALFGALVGIIGGGLFAAKDRIGELFGSGKAPVVETPQQKAEEKKPDENKAPQTKAEETKAEEKKVDEEPTVPPGQQTEPAAEPSPKGSTPERKPVSAARNEPEPRTVTPPAPTLPPEPAQVAFTADPKTAKTGEPVVLHWNVRNAVEIEILPDKGIVPAVGSWTIYPKASTRYDLRATNSAGQVARASVDITVIEYLRITRFAADPPTASLNSSFELAWETADAQEIQIQLDQRPRNSQFQFTHTSRQPSGRVRIDTVQSLFTAYGTYVFRLTAKSPGGAVKRADATFNLVQNRGNK